MDFSWDILGRTAARFGGPFKFRFVLQPIVAIALGVRDGIHDGKQGTPLFLYDILSKPHRRKPHMQQIIKRLLVPMLVAILLDALVQYLLFGWVRISGAVTAGITVMGLPYVIARAVTSAIVARRVVPVQAQPPSDLGT